MRSAIKTISNSLIEGTHLVGAEIGVERGENALSILGHLPIKKLFLIDIWLPYSLEGQIYSSVETQEYLYQLAKTSLGGLENVEILRLDSIVASARFEPGSLDFVYIDASHDYISVLSDIAAWAPKVKTGGFVCGHDYNPRWPGVKQAAEEYAERNGFVLQHSFNTEVEEVDDWWFVKEKG